MEIRTATTEHRTPKIPFSAQYQGVSDGHTDFASHIPIGKNIPIRNPIGEMIDMEIKIFRDRSSVTMFLSTMPSKNRTPIMQMTVTAR